MEARTLRGPVARLLARTFVPGWGDPTSANVAARLGVVGLVVAVAVNLVLFGFKLGFGLYVGSLALIADALDTIGDVLLDVVGLVGFFVSLRGPDQEHPYGHQRAEEIASVAVSILLLVAGVGFGAAAARRLVARDFGDAFAWGAVAVALASVVFKYVLSRLAFHLAEYTRSPLLAVSGWHYVTDVFSGLLAAIALLGRRFGVVWLDPVFAILIAMVLVVVASGIFRQNANSLMGRGGSPELLHEIHLVACQQGGVLGCHDIEVHFYGRKKRVSLRIKVDERLTLREADAVAHRVEDAIHATHADWEPVVHVEPVASDAPASGTSGP